MMSDEEKEERRLKWHKLRPNWTNKPRTDAEQCVEVNKHTGKRCPQWALKDPRARGKCFKHVRNLLSLGRPKYAIRFKKMPKFYSKVLTGTLRDYVEQCCSMEPHEQLALWEELALTRHAGLQAVALYNMVCEKLPCETPEQIEKKLERCQQAGDIMKVALNQVAALSERQSNIINSGKDKVTVYNIDFAVRQVVVLVHDCLSDMGPEVKDRLRLFAQRVKHEVRIAGNTRGTDLAPDQDAIEMDATIPSHP